jgi:hypothetical protein
MKLTKTSQALMSFFIENKCINHSHPTKKTNLILKQLYNELKMANAFVQKKKREDGPSFYKLNVTKMQSASQIPKPQQFNSDSFPSEIRTQIDTFISHDLSYTFSLYDREITIHFLVEDKNPELSLALYNEYVDKILAWLYIINEYGTKRCAKKLTLYIYMTSMKKELPSTNISILDQSNVNTAFTFTCPVVSEIVVFRKEEWLKVLMHETFHNFALDFSDMNMSSCTERILSIFKVESEVNLFEAYTEFWAEIMNSVFCSFYLLQDKDNEEEFLSNCEFFINFERTYGFFQMVKTLNFMGLSYKDLYSKSEESRLLRETMYKEKSNVLAYYVITLVLMNNYQGFLSWCDTHNLSLLQFKKTNANLDEFCKFVEKNYKTKSMIQGVECMEKFLTVFKKSKTKKARENAELLLKNMRMSICELG